MRQGFVRWAGAVGVVAVAALSCLPVATAFDVPAAHATAAPSPPFIGPSAGWLTSLNYYRAMAHEPPVVDDPALLFGTTAHSCYMLINGLTHYEQPGAPGYTTEGYQAGINSNVTVTSDINATERTHVELWMAAPFHAIGVLRPGLQSSNFGMCTNSTNPVWHNAATLDVIRGLDSNVKTTTPILFPGDGTTTNLNVMSSETPDPRTFCGWSGEVGLPIVAMMPEAFAGNPTATLSTPSGPVDACVLSANNTSGVAQQLLSGDHAVLVVPHAKLAATTYSVSVTTSARSVSWSFTVDPAAATSPAQDPGTDATNGGVGGPVDSEPTATQALGDGATLHPLAPNRIVDSREGLNAGRLAASTTQRIQVTGHGGVPDGARAVSGNFTITGSYDGGYLTVWNCTEPVPVVSTLNFAAGETVPNGASIPLDAGGGLCVYSTTPADVVIDVNGYYADAPGGGHFAAVVPQRLMDTRTGLGGSSRLAKGAVTRLGVVGSAGVPDSATMAVLNVTSVSPATNGYVTVFPCDGPVPEVSSLNPSPGTARPNIVITPVAADGSICVVASTDVDLVVDITGYVTGSGSTMFTPAMPFRLSDTRATRVELNLGTAGGMHKGETVTVQVAGQRGIAGDATSISANITAVGADVPGFLTVWPCGPQPNTSTVNFPTGRAVANGTMTALSAQGTLCVYANTDVQVIVDVNGWWS